MSGRLTREHKPEQLPRISIEIISNRYIASILNGERYLDSRKNLSTDLSEQRFEYFTSSATNIIMGGALPERINLIIVLEYSRCAQSCLFQCWRHPAAVSTVYSVIVVKSAVSNEGCTPFLISSTHIPRTTVHFGEYALAQSPGRSFQSLTSLIPSKVIENLRDDIDQLMTRHCIFKKGSKCLSESTYISPSCNGLRRLTLLIPRKYLRSLTINGSRHRALTFSLSKPLTSPCMSATQLIRLPYAQFAVFSYQLTLALCIVKDRTRGIRAAWCASIDGKSCHANWLSIPGTRTHVYV